MNDPQTIGQTPDDLGDRLVFERVEVPLARLVAAADKAGKPLSGRRFVDCAVTGPFVVGPGPTTILNHCSLGDAMGDVRNLFLRGAGPLMTGVVSIDGCTFERCTFFGIGFAGDDAFVDTFVKALGGKGPAS